jgi:hypothetical protein
MATSSEEKIIVNGLGNDPLLQQNFSSLKKGRKKIKMAYKTTLQLGIPSK